MILNPLQRHLTSVFLKIFLRDRAQSFSACLFPVIFMTVFSLANDRTGAHQHWSGQPVVKPNPQILSEAE